MSGELINEAHEILRGLGRADLSDAVAENYGKIVSLRAELTAKEKALSSAKIALDAKDRAYSVIEQRFSAMAAKAATTDSERECNERLTAEIDALTAELAEARRQLKEASEQEPVAIVESDYGVGDCNTIDTFHPQGTKLYAAPVPQPAVSQSDIVRVYVGESPMPEEAPPPDGVTLFARVDSLQPAVPEAKDALRDESNDGVQCPVCGYYCLGRGGIFCIDKPKLCGLSATDSEVKK